MGGFEQALGNTQHHVFPVDGLGDVNTFLLIGAGVLVLSIMSMVVYKCMNKDHPTSNLAMGLGAVLTVLVGGSVTTIALSPTLLAGNTVWLGLGVGAFVLVAIVFAALTTSCNTGANDFKKGAAVFIGWTAIVAATATGGVMFATSALDQTWDKMPTDLLFWFGAG